MKLYPLLPVIFVLAYLFVGTVIAIHNPGMQASVLLCLQCCRASISSAGKDQLIWTSVRSSMNWAKTASCISMRCHLLFTRPATSFYKTVDALANAFENEFDVFLYSRGNNPTVDILRKKLAALDGAEDCLVFNNGAAATTAAVLSHMKAGDHAVCVRNPIPGCQSCSITSSNGMGLK